MENVSIWRSTAMQQLLVLSILGFTGFCLPLASLPYWAAEGGAGTASAGLPVSAMLACTVAAQTFVPAWVERFGVARVFAAGLIALGAPAPFYALSQDLGWLIGLSAIRGVGFAVLTVVGVTVAARITPPARRGEAIGIYGLSSSIPNLLALPGGVALALSGRFTLVAMLAAAPLIGLLVVRTLAAPVTPPADVTAEIAPGVTAARGSSRAAMQAALRPAAVLLVVTIAISGLNTFLPLERPDGSAAALSLLVFGVTAALGRWRAGRWADRVGSGLLLPLALCTATAGLLGVGASLLMSAGTGATALLVVSAGVFGAGAGGVQNLTLLVAFARAGRDGDAAASAIWNAAFDTGLALGAVLLGVVAAAGPGLAWTFLGCALVILTAVPVARGAMPGRPPTARWS